MGKEFEYKFINYNLIALIISYISTEIGIDFQSFVIKL